MGDSPYFSEKLIEAWRNEFNYYIVRPSGPKTPPHTLWSNQNSYHWLSGEHWSLINRHPWNAPVWSISPFSALRKEGISAPSPPSQSDFQSPCYLCGNHITCHKIWAPGGQSSLCLKHDTPWVSLKEWRSRHHVKDLSKPTKSGLLCDGEFSIISCVSETEWTK